MSVNLFKFDDINLDDLSSNGNEAEYSETTHKASCPIAIIGMDCVVGQAENGDQFWEMLKSSQEGLTSLSERRKQDIDIYLHSKGVQLPLSSECYVIGTFMNDISGFDYKFFSLSKQEANCMDPNQRIFLETAWKALENAGYCGESIKGTDTGIFVGFSSDFGESYRQLISSIAPNAPEIAVSGNVKSIIGSRLAYCLDLHGPSMLIDTACSSGLVAMYTAARSIQAGECELAVVGAVKCDILPVVLKGEKGVGIKDIQDTYALDGHTRTFDNACNGTNEAEGSFAFVLKALDKAREDGDYIHAVILGGAVNQDGASNGITAPNTAAQEALIKKAILNSSKKVEDINYIEAHGTATRLGDPIEISGIQRAFSYFTEKKQFCPIGSLKTNIGHLDNASGLGGVAKVVLSMKNKILPASLNFQQPNKNISFVQSPVYINDRTAPWIGDEEGVLRAGINSFGLSGTNCHMILESAPKLAKRKDPVNFNKLLLPLSCKSFNGLKKLAKSYSICLRDHNVDLIDAVFTAACGRMHFEKRLCVIFDNRESLCKSLEVFAQSALEDITNNNIFFSEHRIITSQVHRKRSTDITENEKKQLDSEAAEITKNIFINFSTAEWDRLADLYISGAEIPWVHMLRGIATRRIPLPVYPFEHKHCWVEPEETYFKQSHPLLKEDGIQTYNQTLFVNDLAANTCWELREHKLIDSCILPGTAFLEMMVEGVKRIGINKLPLYFNQVMFQSPFSMDVSEAKKLHLMISETENKKHVLFSSMDEYGNWTQHAEAFCDSDHPDGDKYKTHNDFINVEELKGRITIDIDADREDDSNKGLMISERWSGSFVQGTMDENKNEFLIELKLPKQYHNEMKHYHMHPALMDVAVNAANNLVDKFNLYLPLSYGKLILFHTLPEHIFVYLKKRNGEPGQPVYSFDIYIFDTAGELCIKIENYCIKHVDLSTMQKSYRSRIGYKQYYERCPAAEPIRSMPTSGTVLLIGQNEDYYEKLKQDFQTIGYKVVSLEIDKDFNRKLELLKNDLIVLGLCSWEPPKLSDNDVAVWHREINEGVAKCFVALKEIAKTKIKTLAGFVALTKTATKIVDEDREVHPGQAGIQGVWRVVSLENEKQNLRCIDHDGKLEINILKNELLGHRDTKFIAYRNNIGYEPVTKEYNFPEIKHPLILEPNDLMIISGGTGSLGGEVASYLVQKGCKRLILFGHSKIPERGLWETEIKTNPDSALSQKLHLWMALEKSLDVFEVKTVKLDEYEAVKQEFGAIRNNYGKISGIFHLAGMPGDGFLYNKEEEVFRKVFDAKALSAIHLHLATQEDALKHFVLFSSISSLLLNQGQSDYTAANMVLDAIAEYRRELGLPALSIQWPAWSEIGIAHRMGAVDENEAFPPVGTEEAIRLLDRLLCQYDSELSSVIMPGRKNRKVISISYKPAEKMENESKNTMLLGISAPDDDYLKVAGIWGRTLAINEIDINDEFNSLGGNSLLTSQMLKEYEKVYPGIMEIADLFSYITIKQQVAYLKRQQKGNETPASMIDQNITNDIDAILELVEKGDMTVEESSARLVSK